MPPASLSAIITIMPGPRTDKKTMSWRRKRLSLWMLLLIQYITAYLRNICYDLYWNAVDTKIKGMDRVRRREIVLWQKFPVLNLSGKCHLTVGQWYFRDTHHFRLSRNQVINVSLLPGGSISFYLRKLSFSSAIKNVRRKFSFVKHKIKRQSRIFYN